MAATTTTTTTTTTDRLATFNFVRGWLGELFETISDDQMLHQPVPAGNHPLWIMGHLAWCDDFFCSSLSGSDATSPPEWKQIFGGGSEPTGDASRYPAISEVREAFTKNRARLQAWIDGMDDAKMAEPVPDDWTEFAPTYGALINTIAGHEAMHLGQLTVVRKSLGMKPARM